MRHFRFIALLLCSCGVGSEVADSESAQSVGKRSDALSSFNQSTFWAWPPPPPSAPVLVPVCWTTGGFGPEKQIAMDAIRSTWGRILNLSFSFKDCAPFEPASVRVEVVGATDAIGGGSSNVGKLYASKTTGFSSSFAFNVLGFGFSRDRIRYIAIHEFGHVLNFAHEDDSPQAGTCSSGTPGDVTQLGSFDVLSVMYSGNGVCGNRYGNGLGYLSPSDRTRARQIYGTRQFRGPGDFAGQGKASVGVWRPANGTWYIGDNATWPIAWGNEPTDVPVAGDYNGDGRVDTATWRPATGTWYINDNQTWPLQWGQLGDVPVPCDYNGDGRVDPAVYRPSEKKWYINDNQTWPFVWGEPGDFLVPGDYTGDGRCEAAVFRPSTGRWYIAAGNGAYDFTLGILGDIPVPGDYAGEGLMRPAVWRPSNGAWRFRNPPAVLASGLLTLGSNNGAAPDDIPVPGNYNGDGIDIPAVFHPEAGNTLFRKMDGTVVWGAPGDIPVLKRPMLAPVP